MELLLQLWLPIAIILITLGGSGAAWFVYVRSIEIPWEQRKKTQKKRKFKGK